MNLVAPVRNAVEFTLGLFYPNVCQLCQEGDATREDGYVCEACRSRSLKWLAPPFCDRCGLPYRGAIDDSFICSNCADLELEFASARAAVELTDPLLEVIHRYKYNRALWFEPFLQEALAKVAVPAISPETCDQIVPIPLHPVRLREREFNQAERLARALAEATNVPMETTLVARTTMTKTQTRLSRKERADNMKRAFSWSGKQSLRGERIVLVDDILTTGATASACAGVLKKNGASEVKVWTVARRVLR